VITRRSRFELNKARARAHILEGLLIALANLDDVILTIRQSPDGDIAKERLMTRFKLSDLQAQAILDLQLRRLAALERQKIEEEQRQTLERIAYLEDLLASQRKVLELIKTDLEELAKKYADPRRTRIAHEAKEDFNEEDLVVDEPVLISITQRGYIKRVAAKSFKLQSRGSKGVTGHATKQEDEVMFLFPARTLDTILFFSDKGKVYSEKTYQIPDADRAARGIPIVNVLAMSAGETITAAVAVPDFVAAEYCTMATRNGKVKRVELSEFSAVRPSGLIAISLEAGDELGWARLTDGEDEIVLITERGQALRFAEASVRAMGRAAGGVIGIGLAKGDHVASMEVVEEGGELLVVTTGGYGKRTPLVEYPTKGRATGGVQSLNIKHFGDTGGIAAGRVVQPVDELTIISAGGLVLRNRVKDVKLGNRTATCNLIISLEDEDYVASLARISTTDLIRAGVKESE
jgi:DNA gyrase subunit A